MTSPDPKDRAVDGRKSKRPREADVSVTVAGEAVPKLPHERDESVESDVDDRGDTDTSTNAPNPKGPGTGNA